MMPSRFPLVPLICLFGLAHGLPAADLHVATTGNDANPGTAAKPFLTLAAARDAARGRAGKEPVTVHVADGVYYLSETFVLGPADSGKANAPVVYQAVNEGKAVISGGLKLTLSWQAGADGVCHAATPPGLAIDQVFVNGERQRMARYPDFDPAKTTAAYQGYAADAISKERAARWQDPAGGYIHAMHVARWGGYHYRITGKNADGTLAYEGGWQNNRQMGMHKDQRMVENIREELDAQGEWFHDTRTNVLYYKPVPGTELDRATVEIVRLRHLVEITGSEQTPVTGITLKGFVFRHAARTFMDNKEPLLRSDWTIYRGGALVISGGKNVDVLDCEFDQPGGNAVFVNGYNRNISIKGCHIHDTGASAICFVGLPGAVRNPLFEYGQSQDLAKIDLTPGPKSEEYPARCEVADSLIHGVGRVERQGAGVQISMASSITVRDTSIYDCSRAGINIGDGTWGGHRIERCDVFDTVLETHDHGSFNSWGRDRYWSSNHHGKSQPAVDQNPRLPFLDAREPTVICHSRWRCDHGWDIDLDDGSANYDIHHNLMLAGGLKFREGFGRKAWNNIMVNNGFHPHVWFKNSLDKVEKNIFMTSHAAIGMPANWGAGSSDHNLFASADDLDAARAQGGDAASVAGDPRFLDPANGDFRVAAGSPALALGFTNFPMDQFGVKKPSLKAIAKQPAIPAIQPRHATPRVQAPACYWLGARLHALGGEEFSAFGVAREDGGVQLADVPPGSAAARAGMQTNDLIQGINGRKIKQTEDVLAAWLGAGTAQLTARVVRNQKPVDIILADTPVLASKSAPSATGLTQFHLAPAIGTRATANRPTNNDPLATLTDGKFADSYGPVFANGISDGKYKLDLGTSRPLKEVTSWSYNQDGKRARQCFTLFGSNAKDDPGWDTTDQTRFTAIASIDARPGTPTDTCLATALRARDGQSLGSFRWLVWQTAPITTLGENTAFQELRVEPSR